MTTWETCVTDQTYAGWVEQVADEPGRARASRQTPTVFIDGEAVRRIGGDLGCSHRRRARMTAGRVTGVADAVISIPSPADGVWNLGFFPLRGYAVAIIIGIALAIWIGDRRWRARGGDPGVVVDVAVWAVPFGIIGGRIYHVITSPAAYFGEGGRPGRRSADLGGRPRHLGCGRLRGSRRLDRCASTRDPAAALRRRDRSGDRGRAGGRAAGATGSTRSSSAVRRRCPWAVEIDLEHRPTEYLDVATFHPTFLYESLWMLAVAGILVLADRRWRLGHGRVFALYVALYALGRLPIELLRIDPANEILGMRVNVWVSIAGVRRRGGLPGAVSRRRAWAREPRGAAGDDAPICVRPSRSRRP